MTQNNINTKNPVVQTVSSSTGALITCTTVMPRDDTIPQQTEGDEVLTVTITPKKTTNILHIYFTGMVTQNPATGTSIALFQDATANALAAVQQKNSAYSSGSLFHSMAAGTTSSTTFKIRVGPATASTSYVNGDSSSSSREFGGVASTILMVTEYLN